QLPIFLPDGRHFLYLRSSTNADESGIFAGSLEDPPERQSRKRILATALGAYFVPSDTGDSGWLLFQRESTLMAQAFNPVKLNLMGDAAVLAESVGYVYQTGLFSGAENALVYRTSASGRNVQMTWFDRQGKQIGKAGE